jgi:hypothetical protein
MASDLSAVGIPSTATGGDVSVRASDAACRCMHCAQHDPWQFQEGGGGGPSPAFCLRCPCRLCAVADRQHGLQPCVRLPEEKLRLRCQRRRGRRGHSCRGGRARRRGPICRVQPPRRQLVPQEEEGQRHGEVFEARLQRRVRLAEPSKSFQSVERQWRRWEGKPCVRTRRVVPPSLAPPGGCRCFRVRGGAPQQWRLGFPLWGKLLCCRRVPPLPCEDVEWFSPACCGGISPTLRLCSLLWCWLHDVGAGGRRVNGGGNVRSEPPSGIPALGRAGGSARGPPARSWPRSDPGPVVSQLACAPRSPLCLCVCARNKGTMTYTTFSVTRCVHVWK